MRVAVLHSGGKDSNLALQRAREEGLEVACLVGVLSESRESFMFHVPGTEVLDLVAEAVGERLIPVRVSGRKEQELEPLKEALSGLRKGPGAGGGRGPGPIDGVVSGAVRSEYQRSRLDRICGELGLVHVAPLWHVEPERHLQDLIARRYEVVFTAVAAEGLDEGWLGRRLDAGALKDLLDLDRRFGLNIEGEGGEYETLVLDGPTHRRRIVLDRVEREWRRDSGRLVIRKAHLE